MKMALIDEEKCVYAEKEHKLHLKKMNRGLASLGFQNRQTDCRTDRTPANPLEKHTTMTSDAEVDDTILRRYSLEKQIGKGSYGVVFAVS